MKTIFRKVLAGAFLAALFFNANGQTWNMPLGNSSLSGTYFGSAGTGTLPLIIKTNAVERIRITSTGLVGIGNVAPLNILDVKGAQVIGSGYAGVNTAPANGLLVQGMVGIGTTNPGGLLEVRGISSPSINVTAGTDGLYLGVATCNACGSNAALTSDAILSTYAGTSGNLLLQAKNSGKSIKFITQYGGLEGVRMIVNNDGSVGIGTTTLPSSAPSGGYKFGVLGNTSVNGSLVVGDPATITSATPFPSGYNLYVTQGLFTEKVKVAIKTTSDWSDFVFAKNYKLMPLTSLATYIEENKHLPDVPSAEEVVKSGIDLGKMDAMLLQKIEELTLYMIELEKKNAQLEERLNSLEKQ